MKNRRHKIFFPLLCMAFLMLGAGMDAGAAQHPSNPSHSYLRSGIEKAFNLETKSAIAYLQKAVEADRESPMGYAFLALVQLSSYEMSFDPKDRERTQAAMTHYIREALARGEKRIEENPKDGQACFAMALAKVALVRLAIIQKHYSAAAKESSGAWNYLERTRHDDPLNYDVYYLRGLLHYHLNHLTGMTRFVTSLLITSGDREKGLQELELASRKGDFLRDMAKAELTSVYVNYEKQPSRALPIAQELKKKYPRNYNFSFVLANTLSDLHRFKEAFAVAREIERGIQSGMPPYAHQLRPRHHQLMGRIYFSQGEYARAAEHYREALKDTSLYKDRIRTLSLVRLGMIHDALNERKQAEECYSMALEVDGGGDLPKKEAKKYLETPYRPPPRS
jgi:tetratricopeptide (TPR) repeat protein